MVSPIFEDIISVVLLSKYPKLKTRRLSNYWAINYLLHKVNLANEPKARYLCHSAISAPVANTRVAG